MIKIIRSLQLHSDKKITAGKLRQFFLLRCISAAAAAVVVVAATAAAVAVITAAEEDEDEEDNPHTAVALETITHNTKLL